ncbi:CHAT domain-containing protein [Rhizobium leguminosarum]|uniref:CHAT domain-containing protein n=1 Tax=Rhizobium leguminosarum TaxID=384 RepID=UPI001C97D2BD|nr:CHAT domain-containing protein [Rhizobium leguminosarum]MBY5660447.1 CHAT domain-containing protein [Rhizobium leguminosarum]MBY5674070.1 CHAT domain-containing protein [Rhizobium leguminosarum]
MYFSSIFTGTLWRPLKELVRSSLKALIFGGILILSTVQHSAASDFVAELKHAQEQDKCPADLWAALSQSLKNRSVPSGQLRELAQAIWNLNLYVCLLPADALFDIFGELQRGDPKRAFSQFVRGADDEQLTFVGEVLYFGNSNTPRRELGLKLLKQAHATDDLDLISASSDGDPGDSPGFSADYDFFQEYLDGLSGTRTAKQVVTKFSKSLGNLREGRGDNRFVYLTQDERTLAHWLAHLAGYNPEIATNLIRYGSSQLAFAVGTILLEGSSEHGFDRPRGIALIKSAADKGLSEAQYRYAILAEFDPSLVNSRADATRYYELAAKGGERAAAFALARRADDASDRKDAEKWYGKAAGLIPSIGEERSGGYERSLEAGSRYLTSPEGKNLLDKLTKHNAGLATALGDVMVCVDCDTIPDPNRSADWYRKAISADGEQDQDGTEAALKLARLLLVFPDVARNENELGGLLEKFGNRNTEFTGLKIAVVAARGEANIDDVRKALDDLCADGECIRLFHDLAIGAIAPQFARLGFEKLRAYVAQPADDNVSPDGSLALMDALAFYGDFQGAADVIHGDFQGAADVIRGSFDPSSFDDFNARGSVIRRLVTDRGFNKQNAKPLVNLLQTLKVAGDLNADILLRAIELPRLTDEVPGLNATPADDGRVAELVELQRAENARGGPSVGLSSVSRRVAAAYLSRGDAEKALRYELVALNTDLTMNKVRVIQDGVVPTGLREVCLLTRSSRRTLAYGYGAVSNVLAKVAVNRLQEVRRDIADMPADLQTCFADSASDSYRWLAGLFFEQGDQANFSKVMSMLRDFETFNFVQREQNAAGASFSPIKMSTLDTELVAAIKDVKATDYSAASQIRTLAAKGGQMTADEGVHLKELQEIVDQQTQRTDALIDSIAKDRGKDSATVDAFTKNVEGNLKSEALIQYVVLPDRINALLTTPTGRIPYVWKKVGDKPFSRALLNEKIKALRDELTDTGNHGHDASAEMYQMLFAPLAREVQASGAKSLILQLDGPLKYVPFSALRNGDHYLIESYSVVRMNAREIGANSFGPTPPLIAAFGLTEARGTLPALPGVEHELALVVDDGVSNGIVPGKRFLDADFTTSMIAQSLQFAGEPQRGILHLASHFVLGKTQSDSFLELGDQRLSVADFLKLTDRELKLGKLTLLTLSACDTGYRDIEENDDLDAFAAKMINTGTRAVLASLWEVPDSSTGYFMRRFYNLTVSKGQSRPEALANTMREFISGVAEHTAVEVADEAVPPAAKDAVQTYDFDHPYYWAPFELFEATR